MNRERDLLPWIFGGLSAATVAVAFAAVSVHRAASSSAPVQVAAAQSAAALTQSAQPAQSEQPSQTEQPAADGVPAPVSAPALAQSAPEPEVSGGQIWACTTKGVKTFSNNPCGDKSTLLDVGPINTMNPVPALHYARAYGSEPRYPPGYADSSVPADSEDYSDQYGSETGGNSYTIVQGVRFLPRHRPEHFHRPPSSHNPGHSPAPVRRQ